ncbi:MULTISPECIES: hypothetical protein [Brevibacterium]|uniref:Lipoprotein n=1 Tax=Brevibacterium antiquum CNRZ 918 TaxID=1255637 RepID=A0A2H1L0H3_9MICO|nr:MULTISPECIES: hypothetical protein [Brevibacterium]MDN6638680.1 hypothetical protein [Yaniella sp.]SMY05314.1 hypothetical protein BANT918_03357 [Brevibacterium antiquum CNRZ 918]
MTFWKTPVPGLLALVMFVGLSGCTADDSNDESSPSESTPAASPCEGLVGYESVPADLPDGDTVDLVSTGIPVERPPAEGITREPDGTLTPSMEDKAFLLVGLPRPAGTKVPDDLVSSVAVTTFSVAEGTSDTPADCSEDIEASVTFISSEYLPIWEVKFDSPPYTVSLAEIDAPGVDRMLNFRTDSPLKFAYPDDGKLESKPQFVAKQVYQEYFDSK